jgi:amino acid transporter
VVPRVFGRVHRGRNTPYVAIAFTLAIAGALIAIGRDVEILAATCTFLLLLVFATVNIAVLVLRRRPVEHAHFRTPVWAPILGAAATLALASPLADRDPMIYVLGAGLVGVGALLWVVRYLVTGTRITTLDAERLVK